MGKGRGAVATPTRGPLLLHAVAAAALGSAWGTGRQGLSEAAVRLGGRGLSHHGAAGDAPFRHHPRRWRPRPRPHTHTRARQEQHFAPQPPPPPPPSLPQAGWCTWPTAGASRCGTSSLCTGPRQVPPRHTLTHTIMCVCSPHHHHLLRNHAYKILAPPTTPSSLPAYLRCSMTHVPVGADVLTHPIPCSRPASVPPSADLPLPFSWSAAHTGGGHLLCRLLRLHCLGFRQLPARPVAVRWAAPAPATDTKRAGQPARLHGKQPARRRGAPRL